MGDGEHQRFDSEARDLWRTLAERDGARDPEPEFPEGADQPPTVSRRQWLALLGAGAALAGCSTERGEKILPYTRNPRDVTPGIPRYFATSLVVDGYATGVLAVSHEGRPTKIEGNPDHPASLGGTSAQEQAAVLSLYDPDRARAVRGPTGITPWESVVASFAADRADLGAGLRFLLEPAGSPLIGDLVGRVRARFPRARFTFHAPLHTRNAARGAVLLFGAPAIPQRDFGQARVVVSIDDDFLASGPFASRYARQFAARRRVGANEDQMSRLYVVESALGVTGSMADHRLRRRPSEIAAVAASVAAELHLGLGATLPGAPGSLRVALAPFRASRDQVAIGALARDLLSGPGLVTVGERQPPVVHALGHLINALLGTDRAAWLTAPVLIDAGDAEQDLATLAGDLRGGTIDTLVILGGNPVYSAPADLELAALIRRVPSALYLGQHENETAASCRWFVPAVHPLEEWGDARAYDGTASLIQPLLAPLTGGRAGAEVLALFAGERHPDAHGMVRALWSTRRGDRDFASFWQEALARGVIPGTAAPRIAPRPRFAPLVAALGALARETPPAGLEISFEPSPSVRDGSFTNNPWLLELPDPLTKLTWENAALVSPDTAARLDLRDEDVVELSIGGRAVRAPVLVAPGHADDVVTVQLGFGRTGAESIARGVGYDAYKLRTAAAPWWAAGLSLRKIHSLSHTLARTQGHWSVQGRPIAIHATIAELRRDPDFTKELKGPEPTLMPAMPGGANQWAMTIDQSICTGCSSCVIACQAENNTPVVGKDQVRRGREMHWLRIDTYFHGDPREPGVIHEPMMCQHCEKAPCEYVCPVNATVHSGDGLNEMVYNRCVGTRFCSNNCPYKVRRFNWYNWVHHQPMNQGLVELQRNPDVTVRQRGVMEKCTYCVQRIREAEIHARIERRDIRPGEVVTACAQACPTGAIQFGSLAHEGTPMVQWRREAQSYAVLHELGTRPRTMYLARIDNPNPEIG